MALSSMTGFARQAGANNEASWVWELKSVNGKNLDVRCRLPPGLDTVEARARAEIAKRFRRGNISVGLQLDWLDTARAVQVNDDFLGMLIETVRRRAEALGYGDYRVRIETLIGARGVLEASDPRGFVVAGDVETAICDDLGRAVAALGASRLEEGARLREMIAGLLGRIEAQVAEAEKLAAARPERVRERLRAQVTEILDGIAGFPEDRLMQEVAVLLVKGDIREEIDRLAAHIAGARDLLAEEASMGRRFEFLCQEFNREANTLCSKANDIALTRTGLALKALIDQLREQIQNIE